MEAQCKRLSEKLLTTSIKGRVITAEKFAALDQGEASTPPTRSPGEPESVPGVAPGVSNSSPVREEPHLPAARLREPADYDRRQNIVEWVDAVETGVLFGIETALRSLQLFSPPGGPVPRLTPGREEQLWVPGTAATRTNPTPFRLDGRRNLAYVV